MYKYALFGFSAALDYGTNSGFYLSLQFQEVFSIVLKLINRLVHIGQRGVTLLFFEGVVDLRTPALGQFLERAYIQVAVMKKSFKRWHVVRQETPVLADAVAAHG